MIEFDLSGRPRQRDDSCALELSGQNILMVEDYDDALDDFNKLPKRNQTMFLH